MTVRVSVLCFLAFASGMARAEDITQVAAARDLFEQARILMVNGDYVHACPKLERAIEIMPEANGAKFRLAVCYEHTNKTASAWRLYLDVASLEAGHEDRERAARDAAKNIEPHVPHLTIQASNQPIERDGVGVVPGVAAAVDPGGHHIVARAPNKVEWTKDITLAPGDDVTVIVPPLADVPKTSVSYSRPYLPVTITLGAMGFAWLATSGVFVGMAAVSYDESNRDHCNATTNKCDAEGLALRDQSLAYGNVATVTLVLGLSSLAAAVLVQLFSPTQRHVSVGASRVEVTF